jgi:hypothetical protein
MEGLNVVDGAASIMDLMDQGTIEFELDYEDEDEDSEVAPEEVSEEEESEDDTEDDSEEDEDDGDTEEEPEESDEDPEGPLFDIEIDGETYEVNEEELRSGYLRNEQLVQRQGELEEEYSAKVIELEQDRQQLAEQLDALLLEGNVALQKYRNVNWEQFKQQDPDGYKQARLDYMEAQEQVQARAYRRNQIQALDNEASRIRHEAYLKSQQTIAATLIPELKEAGFIDNLLKYGKSVGYTEEDIRGIADAKALFILNQARLYAESQVKRKEAKAKVSKDLPPVIKPGVPKTKAQADGQRSKAGLTQLRKTGNIKDAASILLDFV